MVLLQTDGSVAPSGPQLTEFTSCPGDEESHFSFKGTKLQLVKEINDEIQNIYRKEAQIMRENGEWKKEEEAQNGKILQSVDEHKTLEVESLTCLTAEINIRRLRKQEKETDKSEIEAAN